MIEVENNMVPKPKIGTPLTKSTIIEVISSHICVFFALIISTLLH
jgi:hypothetical protein